MVTGDVLVIVVCDITGAVGTACYGNGGCGWGHVAVVVASTSGDWTMWC